MSATRITPRIAMEIVSHEGIVREAYRDSVGVWTWSVGLTSATGHDVERYIGNPQPLRRCLEVFVWALDRYADDVREVFDGFDMMEEEFAAALSFHWNTGAIRRATWVKRWKAGATSAAVRDSFMEWRKPPDIIPRRKAECDLLLKGIWSSDGTATEWTRVRENGSIDWSKAERVKIDDTLRELLGDTPAAPEPRKDDDMLSSLGLGNAGLALRIVAWALGLNLGFDGLSGVGTALSSATDGLLSFSGDGQYLQLHIEGAKLALGALFTGGAAFWRKEAKRKGGKT